MVDFAPDIEPRFADRVRQTSPRAVVRAADVRAGCRGRWLSIFAAAGLPIERLDGRGHPCPRCGGRDRFAAWRDVAERGAVHCRHCFTAGTDPRPGDGLATLMWWMGCDFTTARDFAAMHGSTGAAGGSWVARGDRTAYRRQADPELQRLADEYQHSMQPQWWPRLAARLNVSVESLRPLQVGWAAAHRAVSFPMVDADRRVVGIRLRDLATGRKWSVAGGGAGVFWPHSVRRGVRELWITEGPTDCAAALSIGLPAVGRDAAGTSAAGLADVVSAINPSHCVLVADPDSAGRIGAVRAAERLATRTRVRIIEPPGGDLRVAIGRGVDAAAIRRCEGQSIGTRQRMLFDPLP